MNNLTIIILLVILVIIYNMHKTEGFADSDYKELKNCKNDYRVSGNVCIKYGDGCPNKYNYYSMTHICYDWKYNKICPEDQIFDSAKGQCKEKVDYKIFNCPEGYEKKIVSLLVVNQSVKKLNHVILMDIK